MDRHDRLRSHLDGAGCTVCGVALDVRRVRLLAERDDLMFVELPCDACGAATLGMITGALDGGPELDLVLADRPDRPEADGRPPLGLDDVRAMRSFLAGYRGDLRGLLEPRPAGPDAGPGVTQ